MPRSSSATFAQAVADDLAVKLSSVGGALQIVAREQTQTTSGGGVPAAGAAANAELARGTRYIPLRSMPLPDEQRRQAAARASEALATASQEETTKPRSATLQCMTRGDAAWRRAATGSCTRQRARVDDGLPLPAKLPPPAKLPLAVEVS